MVYKFVPGIIGIGMTPEIDPEDPYELTNLYFEKLANEIIIANNTIAEGGGMEIENDMTGGTPKQVKKSLEKKLKEYAKTVKKESKTAKHVKQNAMSCAFMSMFFRLIGIKLRHEYVSDRINEDIIELTSSKDGCRSVESKLLKKYQTYDQSNISYVFDYLAPDYNVILHTFDKDFSEITKKNEDIFAEAEKQWFSKWRHEGSWGYAHDKNFFETPRIIKNDFTIQPTVESLDEICKKKVSRLDYDIHGIQINLIKKYFDNLKEVVKKCENGRGSFKIYKYPLPSEDSEFIEQYKSVLGKNFKDHEKISEELKNGIEYIEHALFRFLVSLIDKKNPLISLDLKDPMLSKIYFGKYSNENPQLHTVCVLYLTLHIDPDAVLLSFDPYFGKIRELNGNILFYTKQDFVTIEPPKLTPITSERYK